MSNKKSNKKGEIVTILTIGGLIFLGAVSIISSVFLKKTQTVKTKAAEDCNQMENVACGNYPQPPPNVLRGHGKKDQTGACNPACCECDEQCPNGQKCNIPNGYCQSGFSCNPATDKKLTCVSGQCVWQPCQGDDCNKNTCTSHSQCQSQTPPTSTPFLTRTPSPTPTTAAQTSSQEDRYCYYSNFQECHNFGTCTGRCIRCANGKYKCSSEIAPTSPSQPPTATPAPKPGGRGAQITPTATLTPILTVFQPPTNTPRPTATPIPTDNTQRIINTKGIISGKINFNYGEYRNIVEKNNFYDFFEIKLVKENSGINLLLTTIGKEIKTTKPNIDGSFSFNEIERFYGDNFQANPNTFSLFVNFSSPNGLNKEIFSKKNFQFGLGQTEININNINFDFSQYFSKVILNFEYAEDIQKPVVLVFNRPFFDEEGNFVNLEYSNQEEIYNDKKEVTQKTMIYFLGYFIGADRLVNYEIMWGCEEGNKIEPVSRPLNISLGTEVDHEPLNNNINICCNCDKK